VKFEAAAAAALRGGGMEGAKHNLQNTKSKMRNFHLLALLILCFAFCIL
jgi:hypothetical protein